LAKKLTADYLERAALHYLGRYSSSVKNLRNVLERKVKRRLEMGEEVTHEHHAWIDQVVDKCLRLDYVNDQQYAEQRVRALSHAGKSERAITATLRSKGVSVDDCEMAFKAYIAEEGEGTAMRAALTYARKRRIGPYRTVDPGVVDYAYKKKEFASMARVGFDFEIIKQVLGTDSIEDNDSNLTD